MVYARSGVTYFATVTKLLTALACLVAVLIAYDHWQQQRAWREACAEADRLDPGWRWPDLAAAWPALPDERNSFGRGRIGK